MNFVKQTFRHDPENGIYGDCFPTCLAILTGIDREMVPHWHEKMDMQVATARYDVWLRSVGFARICAPWNGSLPVDHALDFITWGSFGLPFVFSGVSRNGTNHCVIAQNGKIIWDPAIDSSGIVGPMIESEPSCYFSEWIVRPGAL